MARTTKADVLIPEHFTEAVQAVFAQKTALMGSMVSALGAAVAVSDFAGGPNEIDNEVTIPYFGTLGAFVDNPDGTASVPSKLGQVSEKATVARSSMSFEVTRWARSSMGGDAYDEAARQILVAAEREMDKQCLAKAVATPLVKDFYSTTTPRLIDYDMIVDGQFLFGDESADTVGMIVHSKTMSDLLKLKDASGRPLLTMPAGAAPGQLTFPTLFGKPIGVSDSSGLTAGSTMTAVTATGTSPPAVTLSGTPLGVFDLQIDIVVGGAVGTATFRFSTDGGQTWSATMTTAASFPLIDTNIDSLVGVNGTTGVTAAFAAGTYNADNLYTAKTQLKARSLIVQRNSLAFWYNRAALALQTDKDILQDSGVGAMHLYYAAHRYRRMPGRSKPGVVALVHNVSGY